MWIVLYDLRFMPALLFSHLFTSLHARFVLKAPTIIHTFNVTIDHCAVTLFASSPNPPTLAVASAAAMGPNHPKRETAATAVEVVRRRNRQTSQRLKQASHTTAHP